MFSLPGSFARRVSSFKGEGDGEGGWKRLIRKVPPQNVVIWGYILHRQQIMKVRRSSCPASLPEQCSESTQITLQQLTGPSCFWVLWPRKEGWSILLRKGPLTSLIFCCLNSPNDPFLGSFSHLGFILTPCPEVNSSYVRNGGLPTVGGAA